MRQIWIALLVAGCDGPPGPEPACCGGSGELTRIECIGGDCDTLDPFVETGSKALLSRGAGCVPFEEPATDGCESTIVVACSTDGEQMIGVTGTVDYDAGDCATTEAFATLSIYPENSGLPTSQASYFLRWSHGTPQTSPGGK